MNPTTSKYEYKYTSTVFQRGGTFLVRLQDEISGADVSGSPFVVLVSLTSEQQELADRDAERADRYARNRKHLVIALATSAVVFVCASLTSRFVLRRRAIAKISQMNILNTELVQKSNSMTMALGRAHSDLSMMTAEINNLTEALRRNKHTEDELEVMRDSLESLSATSKDELRGVLVDSKDVTVSKLLGKGGFGVVNLGDYMGKPVAVKQLLEITPENVNRFRFECFLMKNLRHPHIVMLVGVCWDENMLACLLEYVANGNLQDHLKLDREKVKSRKMTWHDKLLRIALQSAMGVQYLHHSRYFDEVEDCWKECIIHRDLKPENILITDDFTAKLSDFGEARATELNLAMTSVGTPIYIAPEVLQNDRYDSKADVYSFGICLVAMLRCDDNVVKYFYESLRKHMKKKSVLGIGINILNNRMIAMNWRPVLPVELYPSLKALIEECWQNNPADRPTFDDIVGRLGGAIAIEVSTMFEPDFVEDVDVEEEKYGKADGNQKKRWAEEDAESLRLFVDISMHTVPAPTQEEQDQLKRMLTVGDDFTFERFRGGIFANYSSVEMYRRSAKEEGDEADATGWGRCIGDIDESIEMVLAWFWNQCSNERLEIFKKNNGKRFRHLVKVSDATVGSRTQIVKQEVKIHAPGLSNRRVTGKMTWLKVEEGVNGHEAYAIVLKNVPEDFIGGHVDDVFSKNSIKAGTSLVGVGNTFACEHALANSKSCTTQHADIEALFLFEKLGSSKTRLTLTGYMKLGGRLPSWTKQIATARVLSIVMEGQVRFKSTAENTRGARPTLDIARGGARPTFGVAGWVRRPTFVSPVVRRFSLTDVAVATSDAIVGKGHS